MAIIFLHVNLKLGAKGKNWELIRPPEKCELPGHKELECSLISLSLSVDDKRYHSSNNFFDYE